MDISHKQLERVDVLRVSGRVDHQTAPELEKALRGVINNGRHNIVVDLSDVSYISSAGLKNAACTKDHRHDRRDWCALFRAHVRRRCR